MREPRAVIHIKVEAEPRRQRVPRQSLGTRMRGARSQGAISTITLLTLLFAFPQRGMRADDFDSVVAPLIARKCLACHNPTEKKGGLDLSSSKPALAGGESGAAIVPGKPDESLLWERVSQDEMPPKKP